MNTNAVCSGLSARRKTTVLKNFSILLLLLLSVTACHDTTQGQEKSAPTNGITQDSTDKPEVNIKVNRRYDDKGNLIGFDSLYSSYYSSSGNTNQLDSIRHRFKTYFNREHSTFFNNRMNSLFFNDTLLYPDFFHKDFFQQHYELNDAYMKQMMQRMDSIKNEFYRESDRGQRKPKPDSKEN